MSSKFDMRLFLLRKIMEWQKLAKKFTDFSKRLKNCKRSINKN